MSRCLPTVRKRVLDILGKDITVSFDVPLVGIWSPEKKNAPFVCIEPWYGRCDAEEFDGTLEERSWQNALEAGACFKRSYTITCNEIR